MPTVQREKDRRRERLDGSPSPPWQRVSLHPFGLLGGRRTPPRKAAAPTLQGERRENARHRALSSTRLCPPGHGPITSRSRRHCKALQAELAKVEAAAAGHRADFERECNRSDKLLSECAPPTTSSEQTKWRRAPTASWRWCVLKRRVSVRHRRGQR